MEMIDFLYEHAYSLGFPSDTHIAYYPDHYCYRVHVGTASLVLDAALMEVKQVRSEMRRFLDTMGLSVTPAASITYDDTVLTSTLLTKGYSA